MSADAAGDAPERSVPPTGPLKIDVVSIFPEYLDPLRLSLPGKAIASGLVQLGVHDLRQWADGVHRKVDDTPYGGGAGMVMMAEPWGRAIDALSTEQTVMLIMTPSGRRFDQALAEDLSRSDHLLIACGRYEGFDDRIAEHARSRMTVIEVSLGDYVLNGGEVAALAVVEAVVRLVPGVIGNPASLAEESHSADHDQLLEYPGYTKPPVWRGLDVPEILFSGHHAKIADWRHGQALARTRQRRPDLTPAELVIDTATPADAGELWTVQLGANVAEGRANDSFQIPSLTQTLDELVESMADRTFLVARLGHRIVGSVQAEQRGRDFFIGKLFTAPDQQRRGIGSALMDAVEALAPAECESFALITGAASASSLRFYAARGYVATNRDRGDDEIEIVLLQKPVSTTR